MHGRDYLRLAEVLAAGSTEAEWRSAVSRAYYAAFHVARDLLRACGFTVPRADQAHSYLWLRLSNAGHPAVMRAGRDLGALRSSRNLADYDFDNPLDQVTATDQVDDAKAIIHLLETALIDPLKTQIADAIKIYERTVLRTVTWRP